MEKERDVKMGVKMIEKKTTKEIINNELGVILNSVDYDVNNALFEINKNKEWVGVDELKELLGEVKDYREAWIFIKKLKKELSDDEC
jgi:hypothetical protein